MDKAVFPAGYAMPFPHFRDAAIHRDCRRHLRLPIKPQHTGKNMSDFNPWGWVKDRFLDQNQVGQDADNSGGILGPVQSGEAVAAPDNSASSSTSSGVDLVGLGSSQSQNDLDDFSSPTSDQPYAWSDDHGATVHI